jgi:uncharacterized membrane protein YbaN (DUF454 family)
MAHARSRLVRGLHFALGLSMLGIAIVGALVPGIPTTGPVLLAAFAFSKSSERFDRWMVSHRTFGPVVRSWRLHRGFTVRVKRLAAIFIALSFGFTTFATATWGTPWPVWAYVAFNGFAVLLTWWIVTRPTVSNEDRESLMAMTYEEVMA